MQRTTPPSVLDSRPSPASSERLPTSSRRRRRAPPPARIDAEIRSLELREAAKSWTPRLVLLGVAVALGAAEFTDGGRDWIARSLVVGLPMVALAYPARKLREAGPRLRATGLVLGAALAATSELTLVPVASGHLAPGSSGPGTWALLSALTLGAAAVEGVGARGGTDTRFGAIAGLVTAFTLYLGTHGIRGNLFEASLGALIAALLGGGGTGMILGLLARWRMGARL
jgi:hypothetical protein